MIDLNFYKKLKIYQDAYIDYKYKNFNRQLRHHFINGKTRKETQDYLKNIESTRLIDYDDSYFKDYIRYFRFEWVTFL